MLLVEITNHWTLLNFVANFEPFVRSSKNGYSVSKGVDSSSRKLMMVK